jgi:hypothetical protein
MPAIYSGCKTIRQGKEQRFKGDEKQGMMEIDKETERPR